MLVLLAITTGSADTMPDTAIIPPVTGFHVVQPDRVIHIPITPPPFGIIDHPTANPTPIPSALLLMISGIGILGIMRWKSKANKLGSESF